MVLQSIERLAGTSKLVDRRGFGCEYTEILHGANAGEIICTTAGTANFSEFNTITDLPIGTVIKAADQSFKQYVFTNGAWAAATSDVTVTNNLTSTSTTTALSAAMGKQLQDTKYEKPVGGIPASDIAEIASVDITADVTITSSNKSTFDSKNWIFKGSFAVTISSGIAIDALCQPPDTGTATIKAGAGVTINGGTVDIVKTKEESDIFSIFQMENDKYFVMGESIPTITPSLTSTSDTDALAASAGKVLSDRVNVLEDIQNIDINSDVTITSTNRSTYHNKTWNIIGTVTITLNANSAISALCMPPDTGVVTIAFGAGVTGNGSNLSITRTKEETRVFSIIPFDTNSYEVSTDTTPVVPSATSTVIGGIKVGAAGSDVGGTAALPMVVALQGTGISTVPPTSGQILGYRSTEGVWKPETPQNASATLSGVVNLTDKQALGAGRKVIDTAVDIGHGSTAVNATKRSTNLGIGANSAGGLQGNSENMIVIGRNSISATHSSFATCMHSVTVGTSILPFALTPTVAKTSMDSNTFVGTGLFSVLTGDYVLSRNVVMGSWSLDALTASGANDIISIGVGNLKGTTAPQRSISIGNFTSVNTTSAIQEFVNIGHNAGDNITGSGVVNIGPYAGKTAGQGCVNIGSAAGSASTNPNCVFVGASSGQTNLGTLATAMGHQAGISNKGNNIVLTGSYSGRFNVSNNLVASGIYSADENDGNNVIATGGYAAQFNKGLYTTAFGHYAGRYNQGDGNIYIGHTSGLSKGTVVGTNYLITQTAAGIFSISPALTATEVGKTLYFEATALTASPNNHAAFGVGTGAKFLVDSTTQLSASVDKYVASQNTKSVTGSMYLPNNFTNTIVIGRDSDADASNQIAIGSPAVTSIKYATATSPLYQDLAAIKTSVVGAVLYKTQPGSKDTITTTTWGMPTTAPSIGQSLAASSANALTWVDAPFTPTAVAASRDLTAADNMRTLVLGAGVNINIPAGLTLNAVRIIPNGASVITSAASVTLNGSTSASVTRNSSNNVLVDLQRIAGTSFVVTGV